MKKRNIFVVEDDPEIIELHNDFLSDQFDVIIKSTGAAALGHLDTNPPIDLAVVDIRLPDMSGIEVLTEIKKRMPRVPVIILTAFGSEDVAVKALRCGARDYVKKPFIYTELMKRINFCLSLNAVDQSEQRKALTCKPVDLAGSIVQGQETAKRTYSIQRAMKYIHDNYAAEINLDRVAERAHLSKYHFSRLFKESTGLTYQSYLNRIRIEGAKKLLDADALSITDAGYAAGYSDLRHFERAFKKDVGVTPGEYRRQKSQDRTL